MSLVLSVCPHFPSDRKVVETPIKEKWYKVDVHSRTLFVPTQNYLRGNIDHLDNFTEAVNAFAVRTSWEDDSWEPAKFIEDFDYGLEESALALLSKLLSFEGPEISVDIETSHAGWDNNKLLLIGFGISEWESWVISVFNEHTLPLLQILFDREDLHFIWQNGKFDTGRLKYLVDIDARVDEDTMLTHYCRINEKRGTHGLKDMASLYLQAPPWEDELDNFKDEFCRKHKILKGDFTYDTFPLNVLVKYLHKDVISTLRLFHVFQKLVQPKSAFIYNKLIQASKAYKDIELSGILLDFEYLEQLEASLDTQIREATATLNKAVEKLWNPRAYVIETGAKSFPKTFNVKSPAQLKWILSKAIGEQLDSTSADILEEVAKQIPGDDNFIHALMRLRKLNKQLDTYVTGLRTVVCRDGRVRANFNLHGTETGRLSCSNPNMQNIPRDKTVKNLFVAGPGKVLVQLDYSQAELRVLAQLSGDPFMRQIYIDGRDLHDAIAEKMFGPDFTKEQRNLAKTINFGGR